MNGAFTGLYVGGVIRAYVPQPPIPPVPPIINLDEGGRLLEAHKTFLGPTTGALLTSEPFNFDMFFDGGDHDLDSGFYGFVVIATWARLLDWTLVSTSIGSIEVDLWRLPLATFLAGTIPSAANSICNGDFPAISAGTSNSDSTETWDYDLNQNDVIGFNIRSANNILKATLSLNGRRLRLP